MILRLNVFEKYLNYLLVFLFFTQLAIHFWPKFAFVYGIRVDYLAPTIYLTDAMFVVLFICWVYRNKQKFIKDIKSLRLFLVVFSVIGLLNIFISVSYLASLFKWLKLIEFIALGYYVSKRKDVFSKNVVSNILFIELVVFSLIGIFQVLQGQTIGGLFYYLGERSFSVYTPGIALVNLMGNNLLRTYATFSHPNSLAGFTGILFIYLLFYKPNLNRYVISIGYAIALVCFVLSFSVEAFIAMVVSLSFYLFYKNRQYINKYISIYLIFVIISSLLLMLFSNALIKAGLSRNESVKQRLELSEISGKVLKNNFLLGTGLNTFSIVETTYTNIKNTVWLLQPVHNIYLLVFVETGILGLLFVYFVLNKLLNTKHILNNKCAYVMLIFVLTTGIFDHYWFTINQNMILLSFIIGILLQKKSSIILIK